MNAALKSIFAIALLSFISHISIVRSASADQPVRWSVATVEGSAQVKDSAGAWQALAAGEQIGIGYPIRTGHDGRVMLTRGDEHVTIGTDSSFEMQPASDGMLTHIFQKVGTLMFKVHKRPNKHFEVQTPYLVAAVKGTTFTVSVDAAGGAVHVVEGLVEVGGFGGGDKVLVRPGKTASVDAKGGGKVQIGVTPHKPNSMGGKQSKAPAIDHEMGAGPLNIEQSSNGLFKAPENPAQTQMANASANAESAKSGNVLGQDNGSLAQNLGTGLQASLGSSNAGGNGNSNAGNSGGNGAGGAAGAVGGALGGPPIIPPGLVGGLGNGNGNGNGKGKN
jgi:FecR protein